MSLPKTVKEPKQRSDQVNNKLLSRYLTHKHSRAKPPQAVRFSTKLNSLNVLDD